MSSIFAQGPSSLSKPHRTAGGEQPTTAYGQSLLACEAALRASALSDRVTVLRPGLVYGIDPSPLRHWIRAVELGIAPMREEMQLSLLHVQDLVDTVTLLLDRDVPCPGTYFLSDGVPIEHGNLIDRIEQTLGTGPAVRIPLGRGIAGRVAGLLNQLKEASGLFASEAQFVKNLSADSWACQPDEAVASFGFRAAVPFSSGLQQVVSAYLAKSQSSLG